MYRPIHSVSNAWLTVSLIALSVLVVDHVRAADSDDILWTAKWNHDGSQFAIGGNHALWVFDSNMIEKKSLLPELLKQPGSIDLPYMAVTQVAWHPSGARLAVSSQGKNVSGIYDIASGKRVAWSRVENDFGRGVSWSPDGSRLAITSDDRLRILKDDGTVLHDIPRYKEAKGLTGVAWRPTGDRIVTVGGRITLHDAQGQPIKQIMHRPEAQERLQLLLCVAWHPSGKFFVVGDYGTEMDDPVLQFWSADGELLKSITLAGDTQIRSVSWNRDGSRLASASSKLRTWKRDGTLEFEAESSDLLWGVDWNPKDDKLLTSSMEGRVTVWTSTVQVEKEVISRRHRDAEPRAVSREPSAR